MGIDCLGYGKRIVWHIGRLISFEIGSEYCTKVQGQCAIYPLSYSYLN